MLRVKVKTKNKGLTVPVPYPVLQLLGTILTSKKLISYANKAIEKEGKTSFKVPQIDRRDLKPLLKALRENRGLSIVETKLKDGTEVKITL
jgi:hypothetical protein